jgi:hypothetical protein
MQRLALVISLAGAVWLTLFGCGVVIPNAPHSIVNPRGASGTEQIDASVGSSASLYPYRSEEMIPCGELGSLFGASPGARRYGDDCVVMPSLGVTYLHHVGDRFAVGGQAGFTYGHDLPSMGGFLRTTWIAKDNLRLGGDFGWGFFYVSASVPFAVRVAEPVWIFTAPSAELSAFPLFWWPVGVSVDVSKEVALNLQVHAQLSSLGYEDLPVPLGYGLSLGVDWRY